MATNTCLPGCFCPEGKVKDEKTGECVEREECKDCKLQTTLQQSTFYEQFNTFGHNPFSGICRGSENDRYFTFDGSSYGFAARANCSYIAAKHSDFEVR